MGIEQSKPLNEFSSAEVAEVLERHGTKFLPYADVVRENGVDGAFLASLNETEWSDTAEDLDIRNRLHVRVLRKEWETAKAFNPAGPPAVIAMHTRKSMASTLSTETSSHFERSLHEAQSYGFSLSTPLDELMVFDDITVRAMDGCNAWYAGVHLLGEDGVVPLSSRFVLPDGTRKCERLTAEGAYSRCYGVLVDSDSDHVVQHIVKGEHPFQREGETAWYTGQIVHGVNGERIGIVCTITAEPDEEEKRALLKQLAEETEYQLQLRRVLVERNERLREQIDRAKLAMNTLADDELAKDGNDIVMSSYGPLKPVTASQVASREPAFPEYADPNVPRRTALLPSVQALSASEEDLRHLPSDFFAGEDSNGVDRTPVPKNDMERSAFAQSLGLLELDPNSATATALQSLVELTSNVFGVAYAGLAHHVNDKDYELSRQVSIENDNDSQLLLKLLDSGTILNYNQNGEPFICEYSRGGTLCNYPITMKKTVVLPDLLEDKSFEHVKGFRFYAGTPIIYQGYIVGTLCIFDTKARHDFGPAEEIRLEQIGQLVVQQIENWALRREMHKKERERQLLQNVSLKTLPPDKQAALVFTDIQGSTTLWETNGAVMNAALLMHDRILRRCIADCNGYEVSTEGDAFHIAFHDPVDAVHFALKTQKALYDAPWSKEVLALPDACDDGKGFRGLRVRIAIHWGHVESRKNEVTGRIEYSGETYYIAKSAEHLCEGGQILATADVWNVVSYVAETTLDSPQVVDLGTHVLWKGKVQCEGVIAKGLVQLVPSSLAYDYFLCRGPEASHCESKGRRFPSTSAKTQRRSFHDAPYENNVATIVFVNTSELEKIVEDPAVTKAALAGLIGTFLLSSTGYQCKDFMVAFSDRSEAVRFGLSLQEELASKPVVDTDLAGLVKVGIHQGPFSSMGPHARTGRADYYGKVVNRAARVADAATPGQVFLATTSEEKPELDADLRVTFDGLKQLKGVQEELALFVCARA